MYDKSQMENERINKRKYCQLKLQKYANLYRFFDNISDTD